MPTPGARPDRRARRPCRHPVRGRDGDQVFAGSRRRSSRRRRRAGIRAGSRSRRRRRSAAWRRSRVERRCRARPPRTEIRRRRRPPTPGGRDARRSPRSPPARRSRACPTERIEKSLAISIRRCGAAQYPRIVMSKQPIAASPRRPRASPAIRARASPLGRQSFGDPVRTASTRATAAARRAPGRTSTRRPSSRDECPQRHPGVADKSERLIRHPDPRGLGVQMDHPPRRTRARTGRSSRPPARYRRRAPRRLRSISRTNAASSQPQPTASGWSSAIAPLPM